ncbi:MAG: DUF362 domain-containing protein [Candidatus Hodarchaeota archaeon]
MSNQENSLYSTLVQEVDGYDDEAGIKKAIDKYFAPVSEKFNGKKVVLKVSLVFPMKNPENTIATNTNPVLISFVAEVLESDKYKVKKILIADGDTLGTARFTFAMSDIKKKIKHLKKTQLLYLDEIAHLNRKEPFNGLNFDLKYPKLLLDDDVIFVSIPKLKINIFARATLSVKNNMGLIPKPNRLKYHQEHVLHKMISALYLIKPPDFVIVDAIISGQGQGPVMVERVPTNLLIMSDDGLLADIASLYLMGITPKNYPEHITLLLENNAKKWKDLEDGNELELINLESASRRFLEEAKGKFKKFLLPSTKFTEPGDNLEDEINAKVYVGKSSEGISCNAGCLGMIRTILTFYSTKYAPIENYSNDRFKKREPIHVIFGHHHSENGRAEEDIKQLDKNNKNVMLFGNCAVEKYGKRFKKALKFKGCTPDYVWSLLVLSFFWKPLMGNPWFKLIPVSTYIWTFIAGNFMKLFKHIRTGR